MALTYNGGTIALNAVLTNAVYLGLSTSSDTPSLSGTGFIEPAAANGYTRMAVQDYFGTISGNEVTNTQDIYFPEDITADWGNIYYFGLFNAATGGNLVLFDDLATSVEITVNHVPVFRTGTLTLKVV